MEQKTELFLALVTAPAGESAADLARTLVERRLAACVNIVSRVRSIYRWEGHVADDTEDLLLIKTSGVRLADLKQAVLDLHSYSNPEFVAFRADDAAAAYFDWVMRESASQP